MVLAVFAGQPGAGKSTLAARVGAALPAAVLAVDIADPAPVAALAETRLRAGHHVVIDAGSPGKAARQLWTELAEHLGVPLRVVEVVCGDDAELRRRAEAQSHDDLPPRGTGYDPWPGPRLIVDTFLAQEPVGPILDYLTLRTS